MPFKIEQLDDDDFLQKIYESLDVYAQPTPSKIFVKADTGTDLLSVAKDIRKEMREYYNSAQRVIDEAHDLGVPVGFNFGTGKT